MRYFESLYPRLEFGEPMQIDGLLIEPIVQLEGISQQALAELIDLDTAYEQGLVKIREVSEGGSVQEILVFNFSKQPLVILEGQGLEGAKQNRVLQKTVVVPPESEILVPVNCVERGRWNYRTSEFRPASFSAGPSVKARKASAMKMGNQSIQSEVWAEVSQMSTRFASHSETEDMVEILNRASTDKRYRFDKAQEKLTQFDAFGYKVSGGHSEFIEIFGRKEWAKSAIQKSIREWLMDSAVARNPIPLPLSMLKAEWRERPSVGVETQLLAQTECSGIAAEYNGSLLHLFCAPEVEPVRPSTTRGRRVRYFVE